MKISIVTDEISADLETAIELGVEWGIQEFELRTFNTERVPLFTDFQKQRIKELIDEYNVQFIAISPGLFKCPYPANKRGTFALQAFDQSLYGQWKNARDLVSYHLEELLPASIDYAKEIGVKQIVAFGFHRGGISPGMPPDEMLDIFRRAADITQKAGLELTIEVEADFWVDTGSRSAAILKAVDHPGLGINWDPGNAFVAGDTPYPDGYEAVRDYVRHVHFKDVTRSADGTYSHVVDGQIDWDGQIRRLIADSYQGYISVETHMRPKIRSARAVLQRLRNLIDAAAI